VVQSKLKCPINKATHPAGTHALREGAVVGGAVRAAHPPEAATAAVAVDGSARPALCNSRAASVLYCVSDQRFMIAWCMCSCPRQLPLADAIRLTMALCQAGLASWAGHAT